MAEDARKILKTCPTCGQVFSTVRELIFHEFEQHKSNINGGRKQSTMQFATWTKLSQTPKIIPSSIAISNAKTKPIDNECSNSDVGDSTQSTIGRSKTTTIDSSTFIESKSSIVDEPTTSHHNSQSNSFNVRHHSIQSNYSPYHACPMRQIMMHNKAPMIRDESTGQETVLCEYCYGTFKDRTTLRIHLRRNHKVDGKMTYYCWTCSGGHGGRKRRYFANGDEFLAHMQREHGIEKVIRTDDEESDTIVTQTSGNNNTMMDIRIPKNSVANMSSSFNVLFVDSTSDIPTTDSSSISHPTASKPSSGSTAKEASGKTPSNGRQKTKITSSKLSAARMPEGKSNSKRRQCIPRPYLCEHCFRQFASVASLTKHVDSFHQAGDRHFCGLCSNRQRKYFCKDESVFHAHLIRKHGLTAESIEKIIQDGTRKLARSELLKKKGDLGKSTWVYRPRSTGGGKSRIVRLLRFGAQSEANDDDDEDDGVNDGNDKDGSMGEEAITVSKEEIDDDDPSGKHQEERVANGGNSIESGDDGPPAEVTARANVKSFSRLMIDFSSGGDRLSGEIKTNSDNVRTSRPVKEEPMDNMEPLDHGIGSNANGKMKLLQLRTIKEEPMDEMEAGANGESSSGFHVVEVKMESDDVKIELDEQLG